MIETVECSSPEDFSLKLGESEKIAADGKKPLFLLFSGSKNSSGMSWCPDCVAADPVIEEVLSSIPEGCVLLTTSVEREAYRSQQYPFRTLSSIKLTCVPTLIKWQNGKALARLNDHQSQIVDLVRELVES